jgi:hypothetical protein
MRERESEIKRDIEGSEGNDLHPSFMDLQS